MRAIILKANAGIKEEFKLGVPWYQEKFYILALKDHVNLGFSIKGLSEKEQVLLEGKGKIMRHLKFYSPNDVDEAKVAKLLKLVSRKSTSC